MSIPSLNKRMQTVIKQHPPCADGIRLLLIDTRIAMEELGVNRDYPTIGMYGNWCVHPKLTHNPMYHDIVADVQAAYELCKKKEKEELVKLGFKPEDAEAKKAPISGKPMSDFFADISNCFRIDELRNELLDFYKKHDIETLIINSDDNWKQFIFLLLHSLVNRPLEVPENKKMFTKLKSRAEREHMTPVKLMLEERKQEQSKNEIELWWVIEMIAPAKITGRLFKASFV